jgi:hypothetical protein
MSKNQKKRESSPDFSRQSIFKHSILNGRFYCSLLKIIFIDSTLGGGGLSF